MKCLVPHLEATLRRWADAYRLTCEGTSPFEAFGLGSFAERALAHENQLRVVAFESYSTLAANAIVATSDRTFSGASAALVHVVFSGAPSSAAVVALNCSTDDFAAGNTGDHVLVQISKAGKAVAAQSLDTGPVGALFSIVATGADAGNTRIYFNNDTDTTVSVLAP